MCVCVCVCVCVCACVSACVCARVCKPLPSNVFYDCYYIWPTLNNTTLIIYMHFD